MPPPIWRETADDTLKAAASLNLIESINGAKYYYYLDAKNV